MRRSKLWGLVVFTSAASILGAPLVAQQGTVSLRGTGFQVSFDSATGGIVALRTSRDFLDGVDRKNTLWRLVFRDVSGATDTLDNTRPGAGTPSIKRTESSVTLTWARASAAKARCASK
jgi:hypothetical protein